jgi:parallel beta-helix repeat protein
MIKQIFISILSALVASYNMAQSTIADNSTISGTWTLANSPYLIEGRAIVPSGQTLTIEPGVEVRLKSSTSPTISWFDYSAANVGVIRVEGDIIADGTSAEPILFTRDNAGHWGTILIDDNASSSSSFTHCIIEYGKESRNVTGITSVVAFTGGISVYNSAINFTNNEVRNNSIDGVYINGTDNALVFTDNRIHNNDRNGLSVMNSDADLVNNSIYDNSFGASGSVAAVVLSNCTVSLIGNLVYDNDDFGVFSNSTGNNSIVNNTIVGNGQGIRVEGGANTFIINTIIQNNDLNFAVGSPGGATIEMEHSLTNEASLPSNITDVGNNILNGDALFTNSAGDDYSLLSNSSCVDAGKPNTTGLNLPSVDNLGNNRVENGIVDIGAIEYQLPLVEYDVVTSSNPSTGGTTSGDGTYTDGSNVSVSATANAGYGFINWTENGIVVSTSPNFSFTISSDRDLVANFELTSNLNEYSIQNEAVIIYPNPTYGPITIESDNFLSFELFDSLGNFILGSSEKTIDIKTQPSGIYVLKIENSKGEISVQRIIRK